MKRRTSELMLGAQEVERRERSIAAAVERQMSSENILEEVQDDTGAWVMTAGTWVMTTSG